MFRKIKGRKKICIMMLILVFSINIFTYKVTSKPEKQDVLILIDDNNETINLEVNPVDVIKEILSTYDLSIELINFNEYKKGTIFNYDFVISIVVEKIDYAKDLFYDLDKYKKPIFWVGNDLNKYLEKNVKYSYTNTNTVSLIRNVNYKNNEKFILNKDGIFNICDFSKEKIKIYSTIQCEENEKIYIMNEKNLWYASLIPDEKVLIFILCDVMNDFLKINVVEQSKVFIDIENINPQTNQQKIRKTVDYLHSEGIPFIASVSPIYIKSKTESQEIISQTKGMIETIIYLQNKGGSVVLSGIKDMDYEKMQELNLDVGEFIGNELRECVQNEIYPIGIKEHSNSIRLRDDESLSKYFSTIIYGNQEEHNNEVIYPYITKNEDLNMKLWESLNCNNTDDKMWFQKFKYNYMLLNTNRKFITGVCVNSYEDIDNLKKIIGFLNKENVSFLDLKEYDNWINYNQIKIACNNGNISVDNKLSQNNYTNDNISYIEQINKFLITVLLIFCVIFISIFIYYRRISKNKFFR